MLFGKNGYFEGKKVRRATRRSDAIDYLITLLMDYIKLIYKGMVNNFI